MLSRHLTLGNRRFWIRLLIVFLLATGVPFYVMMTSQSMTGELVVLFVTIVAMFLIVFMSLSGWIWNARRRYRRFVERGIRGEATIRGQTVTGRLISKIPVLELDLHVEAPDRLPYAAKSQVLGYPGAVPSAGTFPCVIDPKKPKRVEVLFDEPGFDPDSAKDRAVPGASV